jgi:hypothetical protein
MDILNGRTRRRASKWSIASAAKHQTLSGHGSLNRQRLVREPHTPVVGYYVDTRQECQQSAGIKIFTLC